MIESWKDVIGYEGHYEVSSLGKVKRVETGRILKPNLTGNYPSVTLCVLSKKQDLRIHTLVCTSFIGPKPTPFHEVNHKNGLKTGNYYENLEWVTKSEQQQHRYRVLKKPGGMTGKKHSKEAMQKLRAHVPWNLGKRHSLETIEKIRTSAFKRPK